MILKRMLRDRAVQLQFVGLRPSTRHYVYVDTEKVGDNLIKPSGGLLGDALISDADGTISFIYYIVTGAYSANNKDQQALVDMNRKPKKSRLVISSTNTPILDKTAENTSKSLSEIYI